ncbi:MAG TPA: hypothetical protein VJ787_05795, partial [Thermoleophilia bacterium]|nr:hypothetical protein [Thermoleophilia bacterium]
MHAPPLAVTHGDPLPPLVIVYVADATLLAAYPPPEQIALSVPDELKVAEALWVDEVVGVLPSV